MSQPSCLKLKTIKFIFIPSDSVRLGEHTIWPDPDCDEKPTSFNCNTDDPPTQDIKIEKAIAHENFDQSSIPKDNDIALLRLERKVLVTKSIHIICLPVSFKQTVDGQDDPDYQVLTVAGWGVSEENWFGMSNVLKYAKVPYLSNEEGFQRYQTLWENKKDASITNSAKIMVTQCFQPAISSKYVILVRWRSQQDRCLLRRQRWSFDKSCTKQRRLL